MLAAAGRKTSLRSSGGSAAELEAKDPGHVRVGRRLRLQLGVRHEQKVGEGSAEKGAVNVVMVFAAGAVAVLTKRAVHLQSIIASFACTNKKRTPC